MTFGHPHVIASHGSINLSGQGALAAVSSIVSALAIAWLWFAFARGPARPERLLRFAAACLCAFIVFGKVLSPQFLIWLVPLVPLIPGRRGLAAAGLLGFALLDTQVWFPADYFAYVDHEHLAWLVLVRNLALVALFLVLSLPLPAPAGSSSPGRLRRILRVRPRSSPHPRPPQADPGSP
jgi:hypothetical protein